MQGNTRKRSTRTGTLRKRSKAKTKTVVPMFDRCEDFLDFDWGPWFEMVKHRMLVCSIPGMPQGVTYEIDLERCITPAQKCDWLAQVAEKSWADRDVLGGLVKALDAIVGLRPRAGER
jgi:hypothetical protein